MHAFGVDADKSARTPYGVDDTACLVLPPQKHAPGVYGVLTHVAELRSCSGSLYPSTAGSFLQIAEAISDSPIRAKKKDFLFDEKCQFAVELKRPGELTCQDILPSL